MEDSLLEIVKGEVDLMRSAYCEEFTDLREQDVWDVYRAPDVRVRLGPHHSQGGTLHDHVWVVLRIKTTDSYPHKAAEVEIEKCDGLAKDKVQKLSVLLKKKASSLAKKGTVVMMELCQMTESYLGEHARPYKESIYEEMVAGQEARRQASVEAEKEIMRQKEKKEEEQRTVMREEVARVKEELKQEERKRKEQRYWPFNSEAGGEKGHAGELADSPNHGKLKHRSISECSSESGSGENQGSNVMRFPLGGKQECLVIVGKCIWERKNQGCYLYEARDKVTSERSVIYEWWINSKRTGRKGNYVKIGQENQVEELVSKFSAQEKEMSSLLRLSHDNLVGYLGMKINCRQIEGVDVYILQEYVQGMSMKYYIHHQIPLNEASLRHITEGTLKALNYLHQNNVVHRDLRDSSIYLDNQSHLVRVADYGVERRIVEAVLEFKNIEVPPLYPQSPGRGGKKGDIYRLGLVILSIHQGRRVQEIVPTLPASLSADFRNFMQKCLALNEQERWTAEKLLSHPFIQVQEKEGDDSDNKRATSGIYLERGMEEEEESSREGLELSSEPSLLPQNLKTGSLGLRIEKEYKILEFLGKGGFGHVFKVRNTVDDREYAVKRIPLHEQSDSVRKKIIREVKLLSSLNHENVVRYYTSWIEDLVQESEEDQKVLDESSSSSESEESSVNVTISQVTSASDTPEDSSSFAKCLEQKAQVEESEWSVIFYDGVDHASYSRANDTEESDDDDDDDWLMGSLGPMLQDSDDDMYDDDKMKDEDFSDSQDSVIETDYVDETDAVPSSRQFKKQYLFIQMQLCEKNTLRQAINEHLCMDSDRKWRLFRELVNGLDYIHSQGLIHRDLKPGNIFLDMDDHVKIGDFGLATAAIKAKTTAGVIPKMDVDDTKDSALTSQIGTTFYVAPEVNKSKGKVSYTNKVDIYSLGVIFFEMAHPPLTTGMERAKVLFNLRKPEIDIPEEFIVKKNANSVELIKWLLQHDPQQRPSTGDILKSHLLPPPTAEEQKFIQTLEDKLKNVRSSDYQEILNLVFKPCARPELEATFEVRHPVTSDYWQYWKHDYLHSLVTAVFKAHGGIWVPTTFYVPKGSFYNDKDNLVSLMSGRGELVSAQYELRYPFARFLARNEVKYIRRYCIDRVQRAFKVSGIHPKESYECAFDIACPKKDSVESSARVILVAHDIIQQIIQSRSENVLVRVGHLELVHAILFHCYVEEKFHPEVLCLLKEYNCNRITLENMWEIFREMGLARSSIESLKGFLLLDGPIDEVVAFLSGKGLTSRRKNMPNVKQVLTELNEIVVTSEVFGVKFEISLCPLMVVDASLYCKFMCQFLLNVRKKRMQTQELLAQGGSYEKLILNHRSKLVEKTNKDVPYAVGISLFLEKFASCIGDITQLTAAGRRDVSQLVAELGSGTAAVTVMVCAIGPKFLKERVSIMQGLRKRKITADHCHCLMQEEADNVIEEFRMSNFVLLTGHETPSVRVILESAGRMQDRKVELHKVVDYIYKNLSSSEPVSVSLRTDPKPAGINNYDEDQLKISYFTRRHSKNKDASKKDEQITREVRAASARWPDIAPKTQIEVWAVELERKPLHALGSLDIESVKYFNEAVSDIKNMFPEHKDHLEEICKQLQPRIFQKKKADRSCLVLYSLSCAALKRIL
ncbi:eIF-2-alpha kinase GCN2 isoform X2 [Penaeus vannamei]|uniref:eIF-2-alpha kinase GCN2 isoform X2 n=1 Tax=Penaeus vannamei TaxID=6689 RepID=UPI00387F382C